MRRLKAVITPMTLADVDRVMELEEVSFPAPWPASLYRRELTRNPYSHYFVIRPETDEEAPPILGYGGYWILDGDAHITTIAVHPEWRGQRLGEWLLLHMLSTAREQGARTSSLEVRPSNQAARRLYARLGYQEIARRRNYYPVTREDAIVMELVDLDSPRVWSPLQERLAQLDKRFDP